MAHRPGAVAVASRHHLRQPRRGPVARALCTATRRRRWPTTPSRCSTRPASSGRTCTASRWVGWSRSSSRSGTPTGCARSCSERRTPGGPRAVRPSADVIAFFRRRASMTAKDAARASVPFNYGPRCRREHKDRIAEDIRRRLAHPFPEQAYRAQMVAAALHNCYRRLRAHRGADARRPRPSGPHGPGRQRRDPRRADPPRRAADPRRRRSSVLDRAARGRRGDRAVLPRGRHRSRPPRRRRHPPPRERAPAGGGAPARRARAHATRSSTSARTGSPRRCWRGGWGRGPASPISTAPSPEVVELLFAASKIGAVLVPLNWRLAAPELAAVLADCRGAAC